MGGTTRLAYNRRDLVNSVTHASNRRITFQYGRTGLITSIVPTGGDVADDVLYFNYDDNENLTRIERRAPTEASTARHLASQRTYDALNHIVSYTNAAGERIGYEYDAAVRLRTLTYPDGKKVAYAYDEGGRLTAVTDWAGRVTRYTYDRASRITGIEFPNGTRRVLTYDLVGHITRRSDLSGSGLPIVDLKYAYNAAGELNLAASGLRREPYRPQAVSMTYNPGDDRLATYNGQEVAYDRDGRMTRGPLGNSLADFKYDATRQPGAGRHGPLSIRSRGPANRVHDEFRNYPAHDQPDPGCLAGAGVHRTHRRDHALRVGPGPDLRRDRRGTATGSVDSLYLFSGLYGVITDPNGLNFMRYRWYSPVVRRFLTPDFLYGDLSDPGTLNLYTYGGNNPVMRGDPKGLFWNIIVGAIGGAIVGVAVTAVADLMDGKIDRPWQDYASAAIGGAVGGALFATCGPCGLGSAVLFGAAAGRVDAGVTSISHNLLSGDQVNWAEAGEATAIGAALGGLLGGAGGALSRGGRRGASAVLDDVPPPRTVKRVRFQEGPPAQRTIPRSGKGNPTPPRDSPTPREFNILDDTVASRLGNRTFRIVDRAGKEREVGFSLFVKANRKQARRELSSLVVRGQSASRGRATVREAARTRVNAGRGSGGRQRHLQQYQSDLARAGRPQPNRPKQSGSF